MKGLKLTLASLVILLTGGLLFSLYQFATEPWVIGATRRIVAWGQRVVDTRSPGGRDCFSPTDDDLRRAAKGLSGDQNAVASSEIRDLMRERKDDRECVAHATLRLLEYRSKEGVLTAVWRCEIGDAILEFRHSFVEPPGKISGANWFCSFAMFKSEWGIPLGAATEAADPTL
ncbi:MAG: hypothetical protein J2P31_05105 [Blastocatellia bacterium]|nr:hypothetical protein [Blastocatellia bacterium]